MVEGRQHHVTVAEGVLAKARVEFLPGGSEDGTPSFELFSELPLAAARFQFAHAFAECPEDLPGCGIRHWHVISKFFGVLVFYAMAVGDHVEIVDYEPDPDYWELIGEDPED